MVSIKAMVRAIQDYKNQTVTQSLLIGEHVMEKRCNKNSWGQEGSFGFTWNPMITIVEQILGLVIQKGDPGIDMKAKGPVPCYRSLI